MNNKTLTQIMIGAVAFIAGFVAGSLWTENQLLRSGSVGTVQQQAGKPSDAGDAKAANTISEMPEVTEEDHIRGAEDPEIYLVEYSDFECPYCNKFHPTMEKVMEEYGDRVAWVYRHYPLSFHPQAQISAEASECVAKLGGNDAFWSFTDRLYKDAAAEGGEALTEDKLLAAASELGVNIQSCLDSEEMADAVTDDFVGGRAAGVSGTPGTVLITKEGDGEVISGALPYTQVKTILDKYLEE